MRTLLHLPLEIATSFFFAASIGVGTGVVVISYTHRLGDGLKVAPLAFLLAAAGFGYVLWRTYRPARTPPARRLPRQQVRPSSRGEGRRKVLSQGHSDHGLVGAKRARA